MSGPTIATSNGTVVPATIRPRDRDVIIQALRSGVVPRVGLNHIQVGRAGEVNQVIKDVGRIATGSSAVRFVIGDYGAGKTFFLNLARSIAMREGIVVVHADLSPDRRIHATGGQARALYAELIRNMATRTKPEGGALGSVVERFIGDTIKAAKADGGNVSDVIHRRLAPLQELVSGYDFAVVIERYWSAYDAGNEDGKAAALRWLRGEYTLKTEAREALGVRTIIEDASIYDSLKVMSAFVRIAGYQGFFVVIDEAVNIFKLVNAQARNSNYEQVLRIVNDVLQGSVEHMGVYIGGTPEFLMDGRRGCYSYEALRSRLAENTFAGSGYTDLQGPILRLQTLTREELYVLLGNLNDVFVGGGNAPRLVPPEAYQAFMNHCAKKIGESYFRTPRNTIKAFLDLLSILEQNATADWRELIGGMNLEADAPPTQADIHDTPTATGKPGHEVRAAGQAAAKRELDASEDGDDLASFKI